MKKEKKEIALVYLVAGVSSRFGGKIKAFEKVGPKGETLIEYSIKQALPNGFTKIIFIVGNKTEKEFKNFFKDNYSGIPVIYSSQYFDEKLRDKPWGTCDAVCTLKNIIDCPFIICNGDDLYGKEAFKLLVDHIRENKEEASTGYVLKEVMSEIGLVNRGIFKIDKKSYVTDLKEEIGISFSNLEERCIKENDLCSMNIFALYPKTVDLLYEKLKKFKEINKEDKKIECYLPVELSNLIKEKKIKMKLYKTSSKWIGITNPGDEEIVKKEIETWEEKDNQ
jgi:choline kinase